VRDEWVPADQPRSPDGGSGQWHVAQNPVTGAFEWVWRPAAPAVFAVGAYAPWAAAEDPARRAARAVTRLGGLCLFSCALALLVGALGLVTAWVDNHPDKHVAWLHQHGAHTSALVQDSLCPPEQSPCPPFIAVAFVDGSDQPRRVLLPWHSTARPGAGAALNIDYDPGRPADVQLSAAADIARWPAGGYAGLPVGFLIVSLGRFALAGRLGVLWQRSRRLLRQGEAQPATVERAPGRLRNRLAVRLPGEAEPLLIRGAWLNVFRWRWRRVTSGEVLVRRGPTGQVLIHVLADDGLFLGRIRATTAGPPVAAAPLPSTAEQVGR
jgi:hypothetical protein